MFMVPLNSPDITAIEMRALLVAIVVVQVKPKASGTERAAVLITSFSNAYRLVDREPSNLQNHCYVRHSIARTCNPPRRFHVQRKTRTLGRKIMIIRKHTTVTETRSNNEWGTVRTQRIGDAGGITQFGASLQTLEPGTRTSLVHWHERTDEMLFVVSGEVTVTEGGDDYTLTVGDAACWSANDPTPHTVSNRSNAVCSFFIVGTRVEHDVTHYTEIGETLISAGKQWSIVDQDANVLREGGEGESPWQ
jgi:uncharacterized cupin superfamily protein